MRKKNTVLKSICTTKPISILVQNDVAANELADVASASVHGDSASTEDGEVGELERWNGLRRRKSGLTFFNPRTCGWSRRFIPIEAAAIDASRVLLFAITRQTRSLSAMALAAHYIGLGCNVVLVVQHLRDHCEIKGEKVAPLLLLLLLLPC